MSTNDALKLLYIMVNEQYQLLLVFRHISLNVLDVRLLMNNWPKIQTTFTENQNSSS